MFHQQDYDLSRQRYAEYNAQFDGLYVPLLEAKASVVRRLLAVLSRTGARWVGQSGVRRLPRPTDAGAVAE
jgi:hypothetical protein